MFIIPANARQASSSAVFLICPRENFRGSNILSTPDLNFAVTGNILLNSVALCTDFTWLLIVFLHKPDNLKYPWLSYCGTHVRDAESIIFTLCLPSSPLHSLPSLFPKTNLFLLYFKLGLLHDVWKNQGALKTHEV